MSDTPYMPQLQHIADERKQEIERATEVYKRYCERTQRCEAIKKQIRQGVTECEDVHTLFLKAVEAVALATDDTVFQRTVENQITDIYGGVLHHTKPLDIQIEDTRKVMNALKEAEGKAITTEERRRIARSIEAIEGKIKALTVKQIDSARAGGTSL